MLYYINVPKADVLCTLNTAKRHHHDEILLGGTAVAYNTVETSSSTADVEIYWSTEISSEDHFTTIQKPLSKIVAFKRRVTRLKENLSCSRAE